MAEHLITGWQRLGPAVRDARIGAGLTQHGLAERAGVSRAWLARFESGHRRAEMEQVFAVLSALDLAMSLQPKRSSDAEQKILESLRRAGRL